MESRTSLQKKTSLVWRTTGVVVESPPDPRDRIVCLIVAR